MTNIEATIVIQASKSIPLYHIFIRLFFPLLNFAYFPSILVAKTNQKIIKVK